MPTSRIAETLAQPLSLPNGQAVPNRLLKSAMSETLGSIDNRATEALPTLYRRWAAGGIGLAVTGNVMIDRRGLGEPGNVVLEDDRDLTVLRRWAREGKSGGGLLYMQLNHPGRQVPKFLNEESVAPSAVPFGAEIRPYFATPRALTDAEIRELIQRFARAASIAEEAGFDGVQIHGAHGYLVSQFLSPKTNQRDDDWGGNTQRRRRFVIEVYRAIRGATGKGFGVAIKINSADFLKGGISTDDSTETILALAAEGMDFIEISGGTYEAPAMMRKTKESTRRREAYFLDFAETLRGQLEVPLAVTGGFRSGAAMAEAVDAGIDLIGLARPLGVDPDFPNRLTTDGDVRLEVPPRNTGVAALDKLGMFELTWYERQLHRMGAGKEPLPNENPLLAAVAHSFKTGLDSFRTRRAR